MHNGHQVIVDGDVAAQRAWCAENVGGWIHVYHEADFTNAMLIDELSARASVGSWEVEEGKSGVNLYGLQLDAVLLSIMQRTTHMITDAVAHEVIHGIDRHNTFYFADPKDAVLFKLTWA